METKKLDCKKRRKHYIKHGASITNIFISVVIGISFFLVLSNFITDNAIDSNVPLDPNVTMIISNLSEQENKIKENVDSIKNAFTGVSEAEAGSFGIQGLKGAFSIVALPINAISYVIQSVMLAVGLVSPVIPQELIFAISTVILTLIIFAIVALFLNRAREP